MSTNGLLQIGLYLIVLFILVKPLGLYMARIYEGAPAGLNTLLGPFERLLYRVSGVKAEQEMSWRAYLVALLIFNLIGFVAVYALQRLQAYLPLNPQQLPGVGPDLSFNTALSFISNTNWQAYGGETTMTYLTQMLAFTVQNFVSAATGMAVLVALIRGLIRKETTGLGNFWVDLTRSTLYILLPLSIILAIILMSQGVIQNFKPYQTTQLVQSTTYQVQNTNGKGQTVTQTVPLTQQVIAEGPVASQEAIKQLGTNGGGFFNANSAYPYENPTPLSNFLEMLALLLIPASLCYTFGVMVKDRRQGWAIFAAMTLIFIPLLFINVAVEQNGNPAFSKLGVYQYSVADHYPSGNMEGKETRFGITDSAIWASATTAASNGSVNAAMDSMTPIGGLIPMWLMHLGEVVYGGVGTGLYGMLIMVIITVFIAGLMVGRTPEYLGKKIEPFEMKMASLALLAMPCTVLLMTAVTVLTATGVGALGNPGAHGFSETLYAFTSMVNNNGSAFGGINANLPYFNVLGGIGMLIGRYWLIIPVLAIAGSLVTKKSIPPGPGTLPTHAVFFIVFLIVVILIVGALTFLPALALGPIAEQLMMLGV